MVGGKPKVGPAFSWADEVEKEEEEARIGACERERPNPFGSARPREVVLQEKGIDWRKLDQDLHQSSNTRYESPAEKPLKENNPAYSARGGNNKQISTARNLQSKPENRDQGLNGREVSRGFVTPYKQMGGIYAVKTRTLQSKPENRDRGLNGREVSRGFVTPYKQMGGIYAGSPRYQTRDALASPSVETYHNSRRLDGEEKKFQYRNDFDSLYENHHGGERELMYREPQTRQFYDSIGLGVEGYIYQHDDQFGPCNSLGWEREYTEFYASGRRYSMVEMGRPRIEAVQDTERRFLNHSSGCWPLRDERREALLIPEKRPPYLDGHARGGGQWQRPWQRNNSGSRMVNSARSKMYLHKNENKTAGSLEEAGIRRRADVQCKVMNGADSAGNYMKRRMKSGPESNHQLWKRR